MAHTPITIQRDINSLVHGRKKYSAWREAELPVRYAYLKLLRERDSTRRVYPVNPFAEVYDLRENLFGIFQESLDGMGDVWSFLIDGPERAMLIDTGFGLGDLKGLVHQLIGSKPYFVVNTHCHFDHAYGNCQFDTVYCHEFEVPRMQECMNPHIWDYLFDQQGEGIWYDFRREDLIPFRPYTIVGVKDGYTFDLGGGHQIELVFLPGHTAGHCGFLDKKNRIFFPGDDCCVGSIGIAGRPGTPFAEYATVEALYRELKKITGRVEEFDSLFPSHGPVETGPVMLFSAMETCEAVLKDPTAYDEKTIRRMGTQYGKAVLDSGYLYYGNDSVYMDRKAGLE
jgi:glyoxylase-like metal-dependent hydrolase (beta-lactamase superfamily II)